MRSLLDALCRVVADMIKGRDPQDIRKTFHAPDPRDNWAQGGDRLSFLSTTSTSSTTTSTEGGSNTSLTLDPAQTHKHS